MAGQRRVSITHQDTTPKDVLGDYVCIAVFLFLGLMLVVGS